VAQWLLSKEGGFLALVDDYEEVLSLPNGIFRVKYHKLNVQAIRSLRSRWINETFKLRREIASLNRQINAKKKMIQQKEQMVNKLTEEEISKLIQIEAENQRRIEEKANQFLRQAIGEIAFNELQEKGEFLFPALDGKTYRIKKNGELQVDGGKFWYRCCYIKPSTLPLPDIIASVFNSLKHSKRFSKETYAKKTNEEVEQ